MVYSLPRGVLASSDCERSEQADPTISGDREIVYFLKGARTDTVDRLGSTPLHCSARLSYGAATKLLVGRGAVIDAVDSSGHTVRDLVVESVGGFWWFSRKRTNISLGRGFPYKLVGYPSDDEIITFVQLHRKRSGRRNRGTANSSK